MIGQRQCIENLVWKPTYDRTQGWSDHSCEHLFSSKVAARQFCFHFSGNSNREHATMKKLLTRYHTFLGCDHVFLPNSVPNPENNLLHHIKDFAIINKWPGQIIQKKCLRTFQTASTPLFKWWIGLPRNTIVPLDWCKKKRLSPVLGLAPFK